MSQPSLSSNGGSVPTASIPVWMSNIVNPSDLFESEIGNKIGPNPHYPGPIHNIGGLHVGSHCRIPGVQPFAQSILRPKTCMSHCLTQHCYEYGNTRFPPTCECNDKYDCRSHCNTTLTTVEGFHPSDCRTYNKCYPKKCGSNTAQTCKMSGWSSSSCDGNCSPTCGTCNHNSNVIFY